MSSLILIGASNVYLKIANISNIKIYEKIFFGSFFVGSIALILNFFISINTFVCYIFAIIFIFFSFIDLKKNIIKITFITLLAFLTILFEISNRPDAGIYHLPFTGILNHEKIILGLNNLHSRFGYISFIQYISSFFNNSLFDDIGITMPIAIIFSSFVFYFFNEISNEHNKVIFKILAFFIFSIIVINMNRYSGFGNDEIAHMSFFYLIYLIMKKSCFDTNNFFKIILIISTSLFMFKGTYSLVIFLLILIFIHNIKNTKLINFNNIFCGLIIFFWLVKNVLISGCLIFPKEITCFNHVTWNNNYAKLENVETQAWAKGLPDYDGKLSKEEYIKNFNWIKSWSNKHLRTIIKEITPILLIFLFLILLFRRKKNTKKIIKKFNLFILISVTSFVLIWFFYFPLFRLGAGYIFGLIAILLKLYLINKDLNYYNKKIIFTLAIILILGPVIKNFIRITNNFNNEYTNYPWPKIYSFQKKEEITEKKTIYFLNSDNDYFLIPKKKGDHCFYVKDLCTHQITKNHDLILNHKFGYKIISIVEK